MLKRKRRLCSSNDIAAARFILRIRPDHTFAPACMTLLILQEIDHIRSQAKPVGLFSFIKLSRVWRQIHGTYVEIMGKVINRDWTISGCCLGGTGCSISPFPGPRSRPPTDVDRDWVTRHQAQLQLASSGDYSGNFLQVDQY